MKSIRQAAIDRATKRYPDFVSDVARGAFIRGYVELFNSRGLDSGEGQKP